MNDDELDRSIRSGLASLVEQALDPVPLPRDASVDETSDPALRAPGGHRLSTRRIRHLSLAAALVAAVLGLGLWTVRDTDGGGIDAVDDLPSDPKGFESWGPGWHTLEPGSVPAMNGAQLAWTGDRLIVAGSITPRLELPVTRVVSYDPATRDWTELPRPPRATNRIVAAGDRLVVVGYDGGADAPREWATLEPGADGWTSHGRVPEAPILAPAGQRGSDSRSQLLWTGERVIDLELGAVLDPSTGTAGELPMPVEMTADPALLAATPVWTGERVVLSIWGPGPGWTWDALGSDPLQVAGPVSEGWPTGMGSASPAVAIDGEVVVASDGTGDTGYAASLDPTTGGWTRLPDIPNPSDGRCLYGLTAVGDTPVFRPCADDLGTPLRLTHGAWDEIEPPPFPRRCCMDSWLGTEDALIVWSTDVNLDDPRAPYLDAAVWIPPMEPDAVEVPATGGPAVGSGAADAPPLSASAPNDEAWFGVLDELEPGSAPSTKPIVATNGAELAEMWEQLGQADATMPDVDFDDDIVVAATVPGNGCRSELTRVVATEQELEVALTSPLRECTGPLLLWTTVLSVERDPLPSSFEVIVPTEPALAYGVGRLFVQLD